MGKNHDILGVSSTATPQELKTAFKALAKQFHPDINPSPDVAEKFKDITRAYNELCDGITGDDPNEMAREYAKRFYDDDTNPFDPEYRAEQVWEMEETISKLNIDGPLHVHVKIGVPLTKLIKGGSFKFQYNNPIFSKAGFVYENFKKRVTLQPNTPVGKILIFPGEGAAGLKSTEKGDLIVSLVAKSEKPFDVDDIDLSAKIQIDSFEAILGTDKKIMMPTGNTITLMIPSGVQNGQTIRVEEGGLRHADGDIGDLFVQIFISTPILDHLAREKIRQFLDENSSFELS